MNNDEMKKKVVEILFPVLKGSRISCNEENACKQCWFPCEVDRLADSLADALIAAGETIREKAKWLWDYEYDAPKSTCCGGRAMYQPHYNEDNGSLCFLTLSLYCPHCGAKMETDEVEDD